MIGVGGADLRWSCNDGDQGHGELSMFMEMVCSRIARGKVWWCLEFPTAGYRFNMVGWLRSDVAKYKSCELKRRRS